MNNQVTAINAARSPDSDAADQCLADARKVDDRRHVAFLTVERYEAMVDALREAKLQIEYLHGKFTATGSGNAVLAQIDSVLSTAA